MSSIEARKPGFDIETHSDDHTDVAIAGAGPTGLLLAAELAMRGVRVVVLERNAERPSFVRAFNLNARSLEILDRRGIVERFLAEGPKAPFSHFAAVDQPLDLGSLDTDHPYVLGIPQTRTEALLEAHALEQGAEVRWGHAVFEFEQGGDGVTIQVHVAPDVASVRESYALRARWLVGCDGGRSTVRKLAGIEFEGFTYPERFIKIATSFDLGVANPKVAFRNYFSDPNEWCNLFKVQGKRPPGLWRAIFPIQSDETDEAVLDPDAIEARLQKFFPKSGRYEVEYVNVYGAHQRVAASFRKGRVLLAGDSAHVNNPIGGMGMNGGIHDGINLAGKLARVIHGEAGDDLLDLYSRQRRHAAVKYVQAQTIANKRLMEERDPAVRAKNFDELRRTAENPETAKAYMRRAALADSLRDAAAVS